ncbi:helicase associated domain-containing protein [Streptomyces sp. DHE17-7]|uniref:helicase associated domain-containing protein n=1 Tax=Streptomyces sp. DHE17-7 TaxID=2759949 RepID=UPI0022EA7FA6|nr:helicase associated domain-containing protein [Streptomyces sp. DHE17-7]
MNYQAAKQFYEREGHLQVPRKHVERTVGQDQEERELKLGAWIGNQRAGADASPEAGEQLSAIDRSGCGGRRASHAERQRTMPGSIAALRRCIAESVILM